MRRGSWSVRSRAHRFARSLASVFGTPGAPCVISVVDAAKSGVFAGKFEEFIEQAKQRLLGLGVDIGCKVTRRLTLRPG